MRRLIRRALLPGPDCRRPRSGLATLLLPVFLASAVVPSARAQTPAPSAPATPPAPVARKAPRIAILEHTLEGEGASPALAMQLQDGFVLGLVRAGIDVIDAADVDKKLATAPELKGCESSPCLKRAGELLDVRLTLRVRVALTGNSYRMTARLFSTEGAVPAALPRATLSRSCDVCTVAEAREAMLRLADSMRARIESENTPLVAAPPPPVSAGPGSAPLLALLVGVAGAALGAAVIASAGDTDKGRAALGGTLLGAGLTTSIAGLVLILRNSGPPDAPPKTASLTAFWRF